MEVHTFFDFGQTIYDLGCSFLLTSYTIYLNMKIVLKIIIGIIIVVTLPISIYYGLRIENTPFKMEYKNRSYVVTLPNKVWFELNGAMDTLDEEMIFENDLPKIEQGGFDIGPQYPTYKASMENNTAKSTRVGYRVGDSIKIEQDIEIYKENPETYSTRIYFSQYGQFQNSRYSKDGCDVEIKSEKGFITYDEDFAIVKIEYEVMDSDIKDLISIDISCK